MPAYRSIKNVIFDGIQTTQDVDVGGDVVDAQTGIWQMYDLDWTEIVGVVQPISATIVRITVNPALPVGSYRLVGLA